MQIGSTEWEDVIIKGAKIFDLQIGAKEAGQFSTHAGELIKWNSKINLTAITDPLEVAVKHFLDSLAPARIIPAGSSILDMGSGGGFPGIPLKVVLPSVSVSLVDSSRKKISASSRFFSRIRKRWFVTIWPVKSSIRRSTPCWITARRSAPIMST